MINKNKNLLGTLELLIAAFIWGSAFVAQSAGMDHVGPLTFASVRFALGGLVLIPLILISRASVKKSLGHTPKSLSVKASLAGGVICGLLLATAAALQQYGIILTTVSKAGFITTLYVIFVPICGIFLKKRLGINMWIAVLLAVLGLYLLCMTEGFYLSYGDTLVFLCAIAYTAQIIAVDHFVKTIDPILLSAMQFITVGVVLGIPALIFESPDLVSIFAARYSILYAGIMSSGVAFTLQVVAQKHTESTIAAITMSFESVFALLCGWALLGEALTPREGAGCVIMFGAIILAQLPKEWFYFRKNVFKRTDENL